MGLRLDTEIPNLDLGNRYTESPPQTPEPSSPTNADTSGPSSRRTSFSSSGRPSGRSASSSSSRSTSFSLPNDLKKDIGAEGSGGSEEVEIEEMDEEAAKKHAEFLKARGRHYSNEAMAMRRARELIMKDEDDTQDDNANNETYSQEHEEHEMDGGELAEELYEAPGPSMNGI